MAENVSVVEMLPVELEGLQTLCHLEDQVEALVWLTGGKRQNLTLHSVVCHVLQQGTQYKQGCSHPHLLPAWALMGKRDARVKGACSERLESQAK